MINTRCYNKTKLDEALAETSLFKELGYGATIIAHLRSWYDSQVSQEADYVDMRNAEFGNFTFSQVEQFASTLATFHDSMGTRAGSQIGNTATTLAARFSATVSDYSKDLGTYQNGMSPTSVITLRARSIAQDVINEAETCRTDYVRQKQEEAAAQGKKYRKRFSKLDVLKGIKTSTGTIYGEADIFARVYNSYTKKYLKAIEEGDQYTAREYAKILNNWGPLCMYARMQITRVEGIKLGAFNNYAAKQELAEVEGIIDALEYHDAEESTRESWMERKDKFSAFNSLTQRVRGFISSLYKPNSAAFNGASQTYEYAKDDLGNPIFMDPVQIHNKLTTLFRGMSSTERMMQILEQESKISGHSTITHALICRELYNKLKNDPELQTAFYVSYKKGFTPYGQLAKKLLNGLVQYGSTLLNQSFSTGENEYSANILKGRILNPTNSIFTQTSQDGQLYVKNAIQEPINKILTNNELVPINTTWEDKKSALLSYFRLRIGNSETRDSAFEELIQLAEYLNIGITSEQLLRMKSERSIMKFVQALMDLYDPYLAGPSMPLSNTAPARGSRIAFSNHYFSAKPSNEEDIDRSVFRSRIKTVYKYIDNARALEYESRARIADKHGKTTTVYSDQLPCFFTDTIDTIKDFVASGNKAGLEEYLAAKYGKSSYLFKDGFYRNQWLKEWLYDENGDFSQAAKMLDHYRFAQLKDGDRITRFEDLTSAEHAIVFIQNFFYAGSRKEDRRFAHYPVFVLGDSGVARFIKAPIYSLEETADGSPNIFDYFVELVLQEKELQKQLEDIDQALKAGEINPNNKTDNAKNAKIVFKEGLAAASKFNYQMLSFLGDTATIKSLIQSASKDTIRKAVKDALLGNKDKNIKGKVEEFKDELAKLGLLTLQSVKEIQDVDGKPMEKEIQVYSSFGKLPYFEGKTDVYVTPENIDRVLASYVCNSRFAMAQQLQLMTVSPNFYKNIEDLQKRYKEIHASGSPLNPHAKYVVNTKDGPKTKDVFPNGAFERVAYFDDITINSEHSNPDFFGLAKDKASGVYTKYLENTLTDGQGYRTLDSFRQIAIAQGLWDTSGNEEILYNTVKAYSKQGKEIPPSIVKQLTNLLVTIQPQKPFLYTFENFTYYRDDGAKEEARIPVQHKCAEVIIIPELLPKDSHLRALGEAMLESGLDAVYSTTAVKVGQFGATEIAYTTNEEGLLVNNNGDVLPGKEGGKKPLNRADQKSHPNFNGEISQAQREAGMVEDYYKPVNLGSSKSPVGILTMKDHFKTALSKSYVHELALENYYRQQNVPNHIYDSRAMGTQARKIFMDGIKKAGNNYHTYLTSRGYTGKTVRIAGHDYDLSNDKGNGGNNLVRFYNSLIVANIMDAFDALAEEVSSSVRLSQALQQLVLNSTEETFYSLFDYALTGEDKFLTPLYECCREFSTSAKLLSLFKKRVQQQRMCGGSAVQASAFGINKMIADNHTPSDGGLKFEFEYDSNGKATNILWMECEMSFDFKYTDASGKEAELKYDDYCNEDGTLKTTTDSKGKEIALLDRDFPGMRELISYRIPTERAYSMMNLKIVKFHRKENGGIIRVPAECTTIAGFDFDIDKLYFLRREFKYKGLSKLDTKEVWDNIYTEYPELARRLDEKQKDLTKVNKRLAHEIGQAFDHSNTAAGLAEELAKNQQEPKHAYWDAIDLEGISSDIYSGMSKEEFFQQQLIKQGKDKGIKIEYDYTKDAREQFDSKSYKRKNEWRTDNTIARNNEIFNLMWHRLSDPETLESRITPGGFPTSSSAAKEIRILSNPKYSKKILKEDGTINQDILQQMIEDKKQDFKEQMDVLDPMTIIKYNQQNQIAGTLIGVFANNNCNHMFASMAQEIKCPKPIAFCGHSFSDLLNSPKGRNSEATLAEFLAASVDAVKDPVLNFLNLNKYTANTGVLLARLGYTSREIGLLLNQPIIKEACELATSDKYLDLQGAISQVAKKHQLTLTGVSSNLLSESALMQAIVESNKVKDSSDWISKNKATQAAALATFLQATKYASNLADFVGATKFTAANAIGSSWGSLYSTVYAVEKYIKNQQSENEDNLRIKACDSNPVGIKKSSETIQDPDLYYQDVLSNPFAFEQCMYDCMRKYMQRLCDPKQGFFPYEMPFYKHIRDGLNNCTKSEVLSADEINNIHEFIQEQILKESTDSLLNSDKLVPVQTENGNTEYIRAQEYYQKYIPKMLYSLITDPKVDIFSSEFKKQLNDIFQFSAEDGQINGLSVRNIMMLSADAKMEFTNLWACLANSPHTVDRTLAQDLFLYCFHSYGLSTTPKSFIKMAPPEVKQLITVEAYNSATGQIETMSYLDYLNELMYGSGYNYNVQNPDKVNRYISEYIKTHSDNYLYTYNPKGQDESSCKEAFTVKDGVLKINTNIAKDKGILRKIEIAKSTNVVKYIPCISWKGKLYELDMQTNVQSAGGFNEFIYHKNSPQIVTYKEVQTESAATGSPESLFDSSANLLYGYQNVVVKTELKYESKDAEIITSDMMTEQQYIVNLNMYGEVKEKLYLSEDGTMQPKC